MNRALHANAPAALRGRTASRAPHSGLRTTNEVMANFALMNSAPRSPMVVRIVIRTLVPRALAGVACGCTSLLIYVRLVVLYICFISLFLKASV